MGRPPGMLGKPLERKAALTDEGRRLAREEDSPQSRAMPRATFQSPANGRWDIE